MSKLLSRKLGLAIATGAVLILRPEIALYAVIAYGIYTIGNVLEKKYEK